MSPHAPGMRERIGSALMHKDIPRFPKPIRDIVVDLVGNYGVDYRLQKDGQHLLLYSGAEGERPLKVGAQRNPTATQRYLKAWIAEHVPDYGKREKEQEVLATFKCAQGCRDAAFTSIDEINAHYEKVHPAYPEADVTGEPFKDPVPDPWEEPPAQPEPVETWGKKVIEAGVAAAYDAGRQLGEAIKAHAEIEWEPWQPPSASEASRWLVKSVGIDPPLLRCTYDGCTYQRVGKFTGAHLHERSHTEAGRAAQRAAGQKGNAVKKALAKQSVTEADGDAIFDALQTLAQLQGYVVVTAAMAEDLGRAEDDSMLITTLRDEVARLEDRAEAAEKAVTSLQQELDEVNAKLALIREATSL